MGCSASIPDEHVSGARKSTRHRSYQRTPGAAGAEEVSAVTQSTLGEMRQRSKSGDSQTSVTLWIEKICKPERDDNADLYDPIRRHQLSMDSVDVRQNRKESSASRGSSGHSSSEQGSSAPSSAQVRSEQPAATASPVTVVMHAAGSECRMEVPVADETRLPPEMDNNAERANNTEPQGDDQKAGNIENFPEAQAPECMNE